MKSIFFILLTSFIIPAAVQAQPAAPRDFGIGVAIGAPTAITGKVWLTNESAVDFGLAYSTRDYVLVYGDYLLHSKDFFGVTKGLRALTTYIGIGAGIYSWDRNYYYKDRPAGWRRNEGDVGVYIRVPLGVEWTPVNPPLGVFAELVPGISVVPSIDAVINAAIGIRYYF